MNIPETTPEIKRAAAAQLARAVEQAARDRDDPRLVSFPHGAIIKSSLDELAEKLHDLDVMIQHDSQETHP